MIKFNNVSKTYYSKKNKTIALKNISFELPSVGFIGLSGENGCGKTTLLNILSTIDNEFDGSISIDNLDVRKDATFIRQNIVSYVLQDNIFINELTSKENIEIITGVNPQNKELENFNLVEQINKDVNELSGGQRQKVSLLRGLLKNSSIILVDEPTSSLDEKTTKQVFEVLSNLSKTKLVILVSHDMEMMNAYCNLIVKLNSGNLEYIKENNTVLDVVYNDDSAIFYGDVNLHSISLDKMNESLDKNGYFKIVRKDKNHLDINNNYSTNNNINHNYTFTNNQRKLLFKAYFKSIYKKIIAFGLISMILLLCFDIFYDLKCLDKDEFYYETLSKNDNGEVIFEQDVIQHEDGYLSYQEARSLREKYNVYVDSEENVEETLEFAYVSTDLYNSNKVTSIIYSDFDHFDFLYGNRPNQTNSVVITDYVADALIKQNSSYSTYQDVCDKGIYINEQNINISGIIKTDYLEYYENDSNNGTKVLYDSTIKKLRIYSCIYCEYMGKSNVMPFVIDKDLNIIVEIIFDDIENSDYVKINKKLAEAYGLTEEDFENYNYNSYVFDIKTYYGYMHVSQIIDDGSDSYHIYYSNNNIEKLERFTSINYYVTNITNREVFDYLQQKNLRYLSYAWLTAERAFRTIDSLQSLFFGIVLVLLVIITINIIIFIKNKNANLYCLMRISGIHLKEIILVELIGIAASIILLLIFNAGVYFIGCNLLNNVLMNKYEISLSIFNSHFKTYIIGIIIQSIILIIIYFLKVFIRNKKNLRKLLK